MGEKMSQAVASQKELRERVVGYHNDFKRKKEELFDITADMTRQYKGMQEELIQKINQSEATISDLKDQLDMSRTALEDFKKDKMQVIAKKDQEIAEHKQKMEQMAVEFGDMLKDTLDKMNERIETTSSNWESDTAAPIIGRLQEFSMGISEAS